MAGDTIIAYGRVGLKRLVSVPGWVVLAGLAVPWWIAAAAVEGHGRFVNEYVLFDQLRFYFGRGDGHDWSAVVSPVSFGVTVLLPWGVLLPFAVRRAICESSPDTRRRLRLLLVWLVTVFACIAVSGRQRERYYLPLCPAAALLIGWWYSTLAGRLRVRAFAGAWIAVAVVGAVVVTLDTPRYNATTDLLEVLAVLPSRPAPVFALDVQDLDLSSCEQRVHGGEELYVIISERMLDEQQRSDSCSRPVARGLVTRRPFMLLDPTICGPRRSASDGRPRG